MSATTNDSITLGSVLQTLFNERASSAKLLREKLDVIEEKDNTIKQLTEKLSQFQVEYHDYKATCTKIIDDQRAENLGLQEKNRILSQLKDVNVKSIQELCIKVLYRDKKIEELSTKLAEVLVGRDAFKTAHLVKCSEVESLEEDKNELINKLGEALTENVKYEDKVEDLESTIEGQKEHIADLENEVKDLKIRENGLSNQLYWYKLADGATSCKLVAEGVTVVRSDYYEQLKEELEKHKRSTKENCQLRLEIEKLKERLSPTSDKEVTKGPDKMSDYEGFRLYIPAFKLPDDYAKGIWETFFNE